MIAASPWIALAALLPVWLFSGPDPARRAWALATLATLALFIALRALTQVVPGERFIGDAWDWSGPLLGLAGVLGVAALLVRKGVLTWRDTGLTLAQARGSIPIALSVTTVTLGINYALMSLSSFRLPGVPLETWLYQATLPGLVEETVFRGVLLALAERAVATRHAGWDVMVVQHHLRFARQHSPASRFRTTRNMFEHVLAQRLRRRGEVRQYRLTRQPQVIPLCVRLAVQVTT